MPKPVIYLPGLPASHLRDTSTGQRIFIAPSFRNSKLLGPDDLEAQDTVREDNPISVGLSFLNLDLLKQAKYLYEILAKLDIDPVKVGWDWRRPVWDVAVEGTEEYGIQHVMERRIRELHHSRGQGVVVIVHSTGGLILRSLLERKPDLADLIEVVIAFGVPWAGVAKSLEVINAQTSFAGGLVGPKSSQRILTHSWAAWDLMPPDPTHLTTPNPDGTSTPLLLTYRKDASGRRVPASTLTDLDWLHSLPAEIRATAQKRAEAAAKHLGARRPTFDLQGHKLRVVNVVGWGFRTPVATEMVGHGAQAVIRVHLGTQDSTLDGGDKTAPRKSAAWLRSGDDLTVETFHVPVGRLPSTKTHVHSNLWRNPGGRALLHRELADEELGPFCYAALDPDDTIKNNHSEHVRVRLVALDAEGAPLQDATVEVRHLTSGGPLSSDFNPDFEGRHILRVERNLIPTYGGQNQIRRLRLRIGWTENGTRKWQTRSFLFPQ